MKRLLLLALAACAVDEEDVVDDDTIIEEITGDPLKLNVGFNNGFAFQFAHYPAFFAAAVPSPARLCHAYVSWDVGFKAPGTGSIADHASRAFIADWLAKAEGKCDEALITFKAMQHGDPPATSKFADAFEAFVATDWAAEAGFTGTFAFTPWNEPNNADDAGSGLGREIPPRVAARYFLVAERACRQHGCKVAAGDFASNGNMWNDFLTMPGGSPSYLDIYKNEIATRATSLGLPSGFRPRFFAYHGWHDTNRYINEGAHCGSYETCTLRRVLRAMQGSWANVVIWNTEDGVGQTTAPTDHAQACAAAFLLRLSTISARVKRLYITRLQGGPGTLIDGTTPRPAYGVLATRDTQFATSCP